MAKIRPAILSVMVLETSTARPNLGATRMSALFSSSFSIPAPIRTSSREFYSFCPEGGCADGQGPAGKLIRDVNGNLYGTTQSGGNASNSGTVYELMPNAHRGKWKLEVLHTFCSKTGCTDGGEPHPLSGMTYQGAASGAPYDGISPVYGTTILGGARDKGVVFQLAPVLGKSKWSEKVIYSFCSKTGCSDGQLPNRGLILDPGGNLYGAIAESGGGVADDGALFELSPTNKRHWKETELHAFCQEQNCADGQLPGTPVMDSMGNLSRHDAERGAKRQRRRGRRHRIQTRSERQQLEIQNPIRFLFRDRLQRWENSGRGPHDRIRRARSTARRCSAAPTGAPGEPCSG